MNTFIRRLLVLFVLLTSLKLHAQVDTTQGWRLVHGTLLEASPEQIRVEVAGANGVVGAETFAIGTETTVDGCELSRVQAGTQLLIYLSDMNSATPTAGYVKFYGCEPNWNILATILAISPGLLTLETRDNSVGNAGDTLDIVTNAETMFMSCTGMSRNEKDFTAGTAVAVYAVGQKDRLRATSVISQDDCGETRHVEGAFVSFVDTVLSMNVVGQSDPLRLVVSDRFGRPYMDSAQFIYTCSGEIVRASDIRAGERLSVVYLSIPRLGDFLQYGQLQRDCPVSVTGTITAVDGQTITITSNGQAVVARLTNATKIHDCRSVELQAEALVVGLGVDAAVILDAAGNTVLKIQIKDDCPYAFYIGGRISNVSQKSVSITGVSSEDGVADVRELAFDPGSLVLDCMNQPLSIDNLQIGSDVVAYYRTSGGSRIADVVMVQSPCDVGSFSGIVLDASASSIVIDDGTGVSRAVVIDANSKLTDCNGESVQISTNLIGSKVSGAVLTTTKPPVIVWAAFSVGCPMVLNDGGIITQVDDSTVTIQGASGLLALQRSPYTAVYDGMYMQADWTSLKMGDSVCCWYNERGNLLYRVITGTTCTNSDADGTKPMIGAIVSAGNDNLTIKNSAGEMSFAVTSNTSMITTSNALVNAAELVPGTRVSVMSINYNRNGQPVASSVTVMMSPTSVDEQYPAGTFTLWPNPATDHVTVSHARAGEMVTLYDQRGNRVMRALTPDLSVSSLPVGVYSVVLENAAAQRLIIAR